MGFNDPGQASKRDGQGWTGITPDGVDYMDYRDYMESTASAWSRRHR